MSEEKVVYITRCEMARDFVELTKELKTIPPKDIIAVTQSQYGTYTIIYKSPKEWWEK